MRVTDFLLEILTEEMPSSHIITGMDQLQKGMIDLLEAQRISFIPEKLKVFGSCRRLVLRGDMQPEQESEQVEIIGPPSSAAFTSDGTPTPAALGFAKKHGVEAGQLQMIQTKKGTYAGLRKASRGRRTEDILTENLPNLILKMTFPKMMRWGEKTIRFSRPIKNILCLYADRGVIFQVGDIKSNTFTYGHKIHAHLRQEIASIPEYFKFLSETKVIISPDERRSKILEQIKKRLNALDAEVLQDEQLMEKMLYDVEYPYVFLGEFPESYLRLPIEVLSTAMKVGQNLFSVVKGKKQLPYFLGIADAVRDTKKYIKHGNERVLKARLEDARFFWEQDLKTDLKSRINSLDKILFQEELGTYADKAQRLKKIVGYLGNKLELGPEKKELSAAAELSKVDLMTDMVKEFPSLQGKIGGLYARKEGFPAAVWKSIYEHYQPISMDDQVPSSMTGAVLSIADKLDAIVGVIGTGYKASGSKDPFGLRRNAQGICKIIIEKKIVLSITRLIEKSIKVYGDYLKTENKQIKTYCLDFFSSRLEYIYEKEGFSYDLIKAALAPGVDNIYFTYLRVQALKALKESAYYETMILIAKRVNNIIKDQPDCKINSGLFLEKEERDLYTTYQIIHDNIRPLIAKGDFIRAQRIIFRINPSINNFFDKVLVMDEDLRLRKNRIGLLQKISKLFNLIADYSLLVIEGEQTN
ncbi:MAG: glycine--tRNA ligase subunit beta [Candidatus Aminicenantes bacterium]|nr:glycine--tRNA ligase subunit beta [Candidatus Aminicenantes bacterium]